MDVPLPLNACKPNVVVHDDKLYMFGGEIDVSLVENEMYVGCTDIALIGVIRPYASTPSSNAE